MPPTSKPDKPTTPAKKAAPEKPAAKGAAPAKKTAAAKKAVPAKKKPAAAKEPAAAKKKTAPAKKKAKAAGDANAPLSGNVDALEKAAADAANAAREAAEAHARSREAATPAAVSVVTAVEPAAKVVIAPAPSATASGPTSTDDIDPARVDTGTLRALEGGRHADPFAVLGQHVVDGRVVVRAWLPGARDARVIDADGGADLGALARQDHSSLWIATIEGRTEAFGHRLVVTWESGERQVFADAYGFGTLIGQTDLWLLAEGKHLRPYEVLGAHPLDVGAVQGTRFALWAPDARRVSVVGDFNAWDGRRHVMRKHHGAGVWEIFVPGVARGAVYKYELVTAQGDVTLKADPMAMRAELRPQTASVVEGLRPVVPSSADRRAANALDAPISIYEVHLGSWRRADDGQGGTRWLTYRELAETLVPYAVEMGFTHLELLPIHEHPFDGSWGYQPTSLYAPTSRFGSPEDLRFFVEAAHAQGLGVILDWVPAHFPTDAFALARFDGHALYEHADPREGYHPDWNTLIYNFGRSEVRNFLVGDALYWIERFGVDGLRVDAVASMLYRDYSRKAGEWIPNKEGGRENLEAIHFLREANRIVGTERPEAITIAEESTAFPQVSRPPDMGGLGFHFKWNMGWMHDTLGYLGREPIHRKHHHHEMSFSMVYAYSENFVLPLSHDEVVHGKGSLIRRMPGDDWQRFADLRAAFAMMWAHPGKKLLFMGGEFAQWNEWNAESSLDWHLLDDGPLKAMHQGVQRLVRDLNRVLRAFAALHQQDHVPTGFNWLDADDAEHSVYAFLRWARDGQAVAVACNFTPVPRPGYRLGLPHGGAWRMCAA